MAIVSANALYQPQLRPVPAWIRQELLAFLYWLLFLLALEPDNVFRANRSGHALNAGHEVLRLVVASALGACAAPAMRWLMRRFPLLEGFRWRHACLQLAGVFAISLMLILVSCFLAAWVLMCKWMPTATEIHNQLIGNWLLLVFALGLFQALAHLARQRNRTVESGVAAPPRHLQRVPVKSRGRLSYVDLADVDWIETQGNYLALHVGTATHLIRETSIRFEAQLDPERFVRIHRRILLAVDRVHDLRPEANGDATVRLCDGRELRASRRYREALRQKLAVCPRTSR